MRLVVAADGGNSKTALVLATTEGDVLARVSGPGTRPFLDGLPATAAGLATLARSAVAAAGLPAGTPLEVGSFYLANADFPDEVEAMTAALIELHVAERIEVHNDTLAVLKAGSRRGWGIAVVAGAGINATGVHPDGREERFLGIGEFSGDWGGGRSVAVAAIAAAVQAGDRRGPSTTLCQAVEVYFGADPASVAIAADRGDIPEAQILGFTPAVFDLATGGDPVAVAIVQRMADEVVRFIGALLVRMNLADADVEIVLGGGTLQSGHEQLHRRIAEQVAAVAPRAALSVLDVSPVVGALSSALALAAAGRPAIDRARAALAG